MESVVKEVKAESNVLALMGNMEHEQVVFFQDPATGLRGIIGIHDTTLGPALGGCRIWNYADEATALWDVLRLSRGMTFKSAISGIDLGGGKAVIINNDKSQRTEAFWRRFGQYVNSLGGRYITAEDVGTSTQEISYMMKETTAVAGKPIEQGGTGDPSPYTAKGVFLGIKAGVKQAFGTDSLSGRVVAVQGIGHVGQFLVGHLVEAGAKVIVTDIHNDNIQAVVNKYGVTAVSPDEIYEVVCDVYSPCALGATVNSDTIPRFKCAVIAGAANNQLAEEELHGRMLMDRGIMYAPDFLINAGGVISCYREVKTLSDAETEAHIDAIYDKTLQIFSRSSAENITPQEAAMRIAKEHIAKAKK